MCRPSIWQIKKEKKFVDWIKWVYIESQVGIRKLHSKKKQQGSSIFLMIRTSKTSYQLCLEEYMSPQKIQSSHSSLSLRLQLKAQQIPVNNSTLHHSAVGNISKNINFQVRTPQVTCLLPEDSMLKWSHRITVLIHPALTITNIHFQTLLVSNIPSMLSLNVRGIFYCKFKNSPNYKEKCNLEKIT